MKKVLKKGRVAPSQALILEPGIGFDASPAQTHYLPHHFHIGYKSSITFIATDMRAILTYVEKCL